MDALKGHDHKIENADVGPSISFCRRTEWKEDERQKGDSQSEAGDQHDAAGKAQHATHRRQHIVTVADLLTKAESKRMHTFGQ
jgi:hypothetical protein